MLLKIKLCTHCTVFLLNRSEIKYVHLTYVYVLNARDGQMYFLIVKYRTTYFCTHYVSLHICFVSGFTQSPRLCYLSFTIHHSPLSLHSKIHNLCGWESVVK